MGQGLMDVRGTLHSVMFWLYVTTSVVVSARAPETESNKSSMREGRAVPQWQASPEGRMAAFETTRNV